MRTLIKGGVWKNTEDEILKAAVMKYGKNQWDRISSLLVRKSAKQCKARWYEWLDPSIKKTEWSKEEEEKLLHLAKLMPTQWRTIAPIVGRTAAQCLEHYEKLLDAAQGKDANYDPADDPRRLRPGEIDPQPETKPARPDPVDMDEDEKEMLSEARARLANTKGKKAKRKAREKQLEEARRLAALQKRRELKAAGIDMHKTKKKAKEIDYEKEIPFLKVPAPGFYDTSEEQQESKRAAAAGSFRNLTLGRLEGKKRVDEEEEARKRDARKHKLLQEKNMPAMIDQLNKRNELEQARKRTRLSLPQSQLTDQELEELTRLGDSSGVPATPRLLETPFPSEMRAPTPDYRPRDKRPRLEELPAPSGQLVAQRKLDSQLREGFSALPAPKNKYKIVIPEAAPGEEETEQLEEDAATIEARAEAERALEAEARLQQRSQVLKRNLPRPLIVNRDFARNFNATEAVSLDEVAKDLIKKEMLALLAHDNAQYPIQNKHFKPPAGSTTEAIPEEELQAARELLNSEEAVLRQEHGFSPEEFQRIWDETAEKMVFVPSRKSFELYDSLPPAQQLEALKTKFDRLKKHLQREASRAKKTEQKVEIYHGGYRNLTQQLSTAITELQEKLDAATVELGCYRELQRLETEGILTRLNFLKKEVARQAEREIELQQTYQDGLVQLEALSSSG